MLLLTLTSKNLKNCNAAFCENVYISGENTDIKVDIIKKLHLLTAVLH